MKKLFPIYLLLISLIPTFASAHVKWFATTGGYVRSYSITDTPVLIWIIGVLLIIAIGIYLEKKLNLPKSCSEKFAKWRSVVLSLVSIGFGLAFLIFSYQGFIFSPNLPAEGIMGTILLGLQAVAGILILFGLYERLGALILLILFGLGMKEFGAYEMMDALEMIGFAIYVLIVGRPRFCIIDIDSHEKFFERFHSYGVPILRIGTGLNLIVLGFTEKIFAPSLTQNFLTVYQWNFMQIIGFEWFNNYWFAFSAGMGEIIFGLFFLFGLVTRLTTAALAIFLISTLILLGPLELVGHLPHFSIAIVLIILGSGTKFKLLK